MAFNKFLPTTVFDAKLTGLKIDKEKGLIYLLDAVEYYRDGETFKTVDEDTPIPEGNLDSLVPATESIKIDSLKIANFTQEGPEKTARGGMNNRILMRHGKTTRLEMEDAVVNVAALQALFGANVAMTGEGMTISITDKFPGELKLTGTTFFINTTTGEREYADFTVYRFVPDGLFNLTMEAEGDFGVIEIGGEVIADDCGRFYSIGESDKDCTNVDEE